MWEIWDSIQYSPESTVKSLLVFLKIVQPRCESGHDKYFQGRVFILKFGILLKSTKLDILSFHLGFDISTGPQTSGNSK